MRLSPVLVSPPPAENGSLGGPVQIHPVRMYLLPEAPGKQAGHGILRLLGVYRDWADWVVFAQLTFTLPPSSEIDNSLDIVVLWKNNVCAAPGESLVVRSEFSADGYSTDACRRMPVGCD